MEQHVFHYSARVYYEDTDAGGVVYHARYLHFLERARTEYLRTFNFSQQELLKEEKGAFVVKSMHIDYRIPAKLDDLCQSTVQVAYVDLGKMKPVAIPQVIKTTLVS